MKIASISCIKNEADLIEDFVRINSTFIDTFVFIDDSSDDTSLILKKLAHEGFKILLVEQDNSEAEYQQGLLISSVILNLIQSGFVCDWFLPLDCDEFPTVTNKFHFFDELRKIPAGVLGAYKWETYVPTRLDFDAISESPLLNSFKKRNPEGNIFYKIVIPFNLAAEVILDPGSHGAININTHIRCNAQELSARLGHFPIRSASQIIKKNLRAVNDFLSKKNKVVGEGLHVYRTLRFLHECRYSLTLDKLQVLSLEYANWHSGEYSLTDQPLWISPYKKIYMPRQIDFNDLLYEMVEKSWLNPRGNAEYSALINEFLRPQNN